ncbi:hypothetical protein RRG08_026111 [Elysia crispata]|uniref:Uncharacterized protein n=1 Tax=Elysia crispata TaxID=231223 RepID=A0AAE0YS19_9GAST|nr:hypothetical protein RRG08_026111 [Elysia crispata]
MSHIVVESKLIESLCHLVVESKLIESLCHLVVESKLIESLCHLVVESKLIESLCHLVDFEYTGRSRRYRGSNNLRLSQSPRPSFPGSPSACRLPAELQDDPEIGRNVLTSANAAGNLILPPLLVRL